MHCLSPLTEKENIILSPQTSNKQRKQQQDDEEVHNCFNIQNFIVDYVMVKPTPLEHDEFSLFLNSRYNSSSKKFQHSSLQVPVVRIYGPITRHVKDFSSIHNPSNPVHRQSACLHIHGAFPYLLARPVIAGADGSCHHGLIDNNENNGIINWDDSTSVSLILDDLHDRLERTIKQSLQKHQNNSELEPTEEKPQNPQATICILRNISISLGRGFYTYCTGPPCPFLRIEYYHPIHKWRIKAVLEHGFHVPRDYHPKYELYHREDPMEEDMIDEKKSRGEDNTKRLCFRCYEAHVPYTMQMFKDSNLAGMKAVKVKGGRFRSPLPVSIRKTCNEIEKQEYDNHATIHPYLVLQDSIQPKFIWKKMYVTENKYEILIQNEEDTIMTQFKMSKLTTNAISMNPHKDKNSKSELENNNKLQMLLPENEQFWTRKETSCDLELDVTVDNILNIHDVITKYPSKYDNKNSDNIYWRSVPSLYELWEEEKRRMSHLLPPEKDFLNLFRSTPSILHKQKPDKLHWLKNTNTEPHKKMSKTMMIQTSPKSKENHSYSEGTRLALEGIKKLYQPSPGLEETLRGSLIDILHRHETFLERVDQIQKRVKEQPLVQEVLIKNLDLESYGICYKNYLTHSLTNILSITGKSATRGDIDDTNTLDLLESLHGRFNKNKIHNPFPNKFSTPSPQRPKKVDNTVIIVHSSSLDCIVPLNPYLLNTTFINLTNTTKPLEIIAPTSSFLATPWKSIIKSIPKYTSMSISSLISKKNMKTTQLSLIPLTQNDIKKLNDAIVFNQRVDYYFTPFTQNQGSSNRVIDNLCIDSLTLTPYQVDIFNDNNFDFLDEEEKLGEKGIEMELSHLATQDIFSSEQQSEFQPVTNIDVMNDYRNEEPIDRNSLSDEEVEECQERIVNEKKVNSKQDSVMKYLLSTNERLPQDFIVGTEGTLFQKSTVLPKKSSNINKDSLLLEWKEYIPFQYLAINNQTNKKVSTNFSSSVQKWNLKQRKKKIDSVKQNSKAAINLQNKNNPLTIMDIEETIPQGNGHSQSQSYMVCCPSPSRTNIRFPSKSQIPLQKEFRHSISKEYTIISKKKNPVQKVKILTQLNPTNQRGKVLFKASGAMKSTPVIMTLKDSYYSLVVSTLLTFMSIEIHVQCRTGKAGANDSIEISMVPDPNLDAILAVSYVYACDPGKGDNIQILEHGCLFVPLEVEMNEYFNESKSFDNLPMIRNSMGMGSKVNMEILPTERKLLVRLAYIVQCKDPDALMSWDTQSDGLGYLVERGMTINKGDKNTYELIDMVRLLGRCPGALNRQFFDLYKLSCPITVSRTSFDHIVPNLNENKISIYSNEDAHHFWIGSMMGTEWDEQVSAGRAVSSIVGRLIFCGWKFFSEEVKHPNASYLQAVIAAVLYKRLPFHDSLILNIWYGAKQGAERWRVMQYILQKAHATILLFDAIDFIGRVGEAARLSGVEFAQSFPGIRGSQYKVEGVLLRALKSEWLDECSKTTKHYKGKEAKATNKELNEIFPSQSPLLLQRNTKRQRIDDTEIYNDLGYFFFSPSKEDCLKQEALERQALTLEPKSGFYFDPVVVCDFTSLYPSLFIAYNLCYSTLAGKLDYHSSQVELRREGCTTKRLGPFLYDEQRSAAVLKHHMKSLLTPAGDDRSYVVPTGSIFVSEDVIKGVIPQVLAEILSTRSMLKKAMTEYHNISNPPMSVLRHMEARQLALKYVANVTYGYTSAIFSGRSSMPLLADAIVECGRRTLKNAIDLAISWGKDKRGKWFGADVIYGDTDSIFINLPGRTVKEAFLFGEEFCNVITSSNPPPVQLKLEKVYIASMMQTKKKYCGIKFESPNDKSPIFESKGLETIRRDQCLLTRRILQHVLIGVLRGRDINLMRNYVFRQWSLILGDRVPVSDFILSGRVRSQYRGGKVGIVQSILARRLAEADPGRKVRHKERVPYVIVVAPGRSFRLRDCVLTPNELLEQWDLYAIHAAYYIKKHVNSALQRCLGLAPFKINVNTWYQISPKPRKRVHHWPISRACGHIIISSYFGSDICALCGKKHVSKGYSKMVICNVCRNDRDHSSLTALNKVRDTQKFANYIASFCQDCNGCLEHSGSFADEKFLPRNYVNSKVNSINVGIYSPLATCSCIDCPITYKRHELRESEIEALELCRELDIF